MRRERHRLGRTFVRIERPEKRDPPPGRARVLAFIESEIDAGRGWPSHQTIADAMGWRTIGSVSNALDGLTGDGHVRRAGFDGRKVVWELV